MRIKSDFLLRQVAGTWVILPVGDQTNKFTGVLTPNNSGALLWQHLEKGCREDELVKTLTEEYDVSADQARMDVEEFVQKLRDAGCLED